MSRRHRRRAIAAVVALSVLGGIGAYGLMADATTAPSFDKRFGDPDALVLGANARSVIGGAGHPTGGGTEEGAGPDSYAMQEYMARALPLDTIPANATQLAQETWQSYPENKEHTGPNNRNHPFSWQLIGPTHSRMPQQLTFSGRDYRASGRTTALAITPTCTPSNCTLWIGAAGGGIWRTDNPLSPDPKWVFVSSGFKTNAIGTLRQDPSDPTGRTLYAGTGEPNASGDSMAGVGVYKTTNGGDTWTLLPGSAAFATRSVGEIAIDPTNPNHILVAVARGIRGYSSKTGGVFSRTGPCTTLPGGLSCGDGPDQAPLGLYESTDGGNTFVLAWDSAGSVRGANDVEFDPSNPTVVYVSAFQRGIWRRDPSKGETAFTQVFATNNPGANTSRTQFDLTTISTPAGPATRIYAADGNTGARFVGNPPEEVAFSAASVWRVDGADTMTAAALVASQASPYDGVGWDAKSSRTERPRAAPYRESYDYCTGQCWYDNDIYTPDGFPDVVYVMGSYSYSELRNASNGRGLIMSSTAGDPNPAFRNSSWNDMTWDNTPADQPDHLHPDHHEVITPKGQPFVFFSASDGGVVRSDGTFDDQSSECSDPKSHVNDPDSLALCIRLLSRVPHQLYDSVNKGLSTLQFQSYVDDPQRSNNGQAGTQDNGTMEWQGTPNEWVNEMYGDGGNGFRDYCDSKIHGNTFFTQATDTNFHDGMVTKWVVTSGPLFNGGEGSLFYGPIAADYTNCGDIRDFPQFRTEAARLANTNQTTFAQQNGGSVIGAKIGFKYIGLNHVWRTIDNGGPQDYLEANCPEFTTSAADPRCGDWKPLGGPQGVNQPGDLTGTVYGADRITGFVVEIQRSPYDSNTIWAATTNGRLFVSRNVNSVDPASVQWCRLDNRAVPYSPPRFITSIVPTENPRRVFVSYNGYNSNTRDQRGHVFEVTFSDDCSGPVSWRDLAVEQGSDDHSDIAGDIPITDLVRDDYTGDLYASTDFGVLRGQPAAPLGAVGSAYAWARVGTGFPFVETPGLTIDPCERELFAATHGRGIWRMYIAPLASKPAQQRCPRTP
jgi:hypothetical protein